jgi:hypothetical protein
MFAKSRPWCSIQNTHCPVRAILRSLPLQRAIVEMTSAVATAIHSPAQDARYAILNARSHTRDTFDVRIRTGRACVVTNYI